MTIYKCAVCKTEYENKTNADICALTHTDMKFRKRVRYIVDNIETEDKEFRRKLEKEWEEIKSYTQKRLASDLLSLPEIGLKGEYEKEKIPKRRNRVHLDDEVESDTHSQSGELIGYAREKGRADLLREMLKQDTTRDCIYGSGKVVLVYWGMRENPPQKLSRCLISTQIGETSTTHGRTRRLREAGCNQPNYSFLSSNWKCKYASGEIFEE